MDVNEQQQRFKRYLNGTAPPSERRWVEEWYAAFARVPDGAVRAAANDAAKADLMSRIKHRIGYRRRLYRWTSAAACALLALGFGFWYSDGLPGSGRTAETVVTGVGGERCPVWLADSTVVWLNGESQLRYVSNYGNRDRQVWLDYGEAFFEVMPDTVKPFTVHTDELDVNVLGTAFNVAIDTAGDVAVGVRRGKVQVMRGTQELGILTKGGQLQLQPDRMAYSVSQTDAGWIAGWQLDKLELTDVGLGTLSRALADFYGIPVRVAGNDRHRFTLTLDRGVSVYGTLEIIAAIHPITYNKTADGGILIVPNTR